MFYCPGHTKLSSVVLEDLPELKSFFHDANFEFHLPTLNEVEVDVCRFSTLFTFSKLKSLPLKNLRVHDCELFDNIVEDLRGVKTCDNIITLSQLTEVSLENLQNLKSFFDSATYELHMPAMQKVKVDQCGLSNALFKRFVFKNLKQLKELSVCDCELLEGIFEDSRGEGTLDIRGEIITLNRVSTIHLQGLPKFKSIFHGATYKCYMPALKKVEITSCGLSVLFSCSVFRELQQLEELHISHCDSLEQIVEEVGGDETSEMNGKSIRSPELLSINLESLPNLKSFSSTSSYVFNMPKLEYFRFVKCPKIEYFSYSKTTTSSVVHVITDLCSEEGLDLNDYVRQNHKRGNSLSDCGGESSYSSQGLGTQSEKTEEERPQETEIDQRDSSV